MARPPVAACALRAPCASPLARRAATALPVLGGGGAVALRGHTLAASCAGVASVRGWPPVRGSCLLARHRYRGVRCAPLVPGVPPAYCVGCGRACTARWLSSAWRLAGSFRASRTFRRDDAPAATFASSVGCTATAFGRASRLLHLRLWLSGCLSPTCRLRWDKPAGMGCAPGLRLGSS